MRYYTNRLPIIQLCMDLNVLANSQTNIFDMYRDTNRQMAVGRGIIILHQIHLGAFIIRYICQYRQAHKTEIFQKYAYWQTSKTYKFGCWCTFLSLMSLPNKCKYRHANCQTNNLSDNYYEKNNKRFCLVKGPWNI